MAFQKKHPNWKIRTESSTSKQEAHKSHQLHLQIEGIAFKLMLLSAFFFFIGITTTCIFFASVLIWFNTSANQRSTIDYSPFLLTSTGGLVNVFSGFFIRKIATDFRALRRWTYGWVEFLAKWSNWGFMFKKDLFSWDVREAFGQPEYEYPDQPEYGYKLEDNQNSKK